MGRGVDIAFGSIIFLGLIVPAWQMHVISWQEPRYVIPLIPLVLIYLAGGLSMIYKWRRPVALIFTLVFLVSFLHTGTGLVAIEQDYTNVGYFYSSLDIQMPRDSLIIVSNPDKLRDLGYSNVYPLKNNDFNGILKMAEKTDAEYLVVDPSSINNQDQILLVTHWYPNMIPKEFIKIGGRRYKPTSYKIVLENQL